MTKKRLFEVLDEMNVEDTEKGTRLVAVSSNFVSGNKVKQGGVLTMGVPEESLLDIFNETKIPVLLILDKAEYFKRIEQ